jgi:hypothetical protein
VANYRIKIKSNQKEGSSFKQGVFSASNLHTALARALTGCDPMEKMGIAHTGPKSDKLTLREKLIIEVERI